MKMTIDQYQFSDLFEQYNRSNNFSREARELIFEYIEEIDPNAEVDIIAICCDFREDDVYSIADNYRIAIDRETMDDEEVYQVVLDYLSQCTTVVGSTYCATHLVYEVF